VKLVIEVGDGVDIANTKTGIGHSVGVTARRHLQVRGVIVGSIKLGDCVIVGTGLRGLLSKCASRATNRGATKDTKATRKVLLMGY
jgi:hypothetical protein